MTKPTEWWTLRGAYQHHQWANSAFAVINAVLCSYAIVAFVGVPSPRSAPAELVAPGTVSGRREMLALPAPSGDGGGGPGPVA